MTTSSSTLPDPIEARRAGPAPLKRPSVIQLLDGARVTSKSSELDISFAYDVTPAVVVALCTAMPHLRKLIVRDVGLTRLPEEVGALRELKELDVSHNALQSLPRSLGGLDRLQHLNLSRNHITTLPDGLEGLTSLRLLNANYNKINALPRAMASLSALRVLRLGANSLKTVPHALTELVDLRLLQMAYNALEEVPAALWRLPALKVVDLSHNLIARWPEDTHLPPSLSTLTLTGNPLVDVPPSLVLAQSHELKIVGLPKNAGEFTHTGRVVPLTDADARERAALGANLAGAQDVTGLLFAGLGDFSMPGEAPTNPETPTSTGSESTEPLGALPRRPR